VTAAALDAMVGLPALVNLSAYRGDAWSQPFRFLRDDEPLDLSGYTAAAECRSPGDEVFPMVATLGEDAGTVVLAFPSGEFPPPRDYRYDIELTDDAGTVTTWVAGRLRVRRDVTNERNNLG